MKTLRFGVGTSHLRAACHLGSKNYWILHLYFYIHRKNLIFLFSILFSGMKIWASAWSVVWITVFSVNINVRTISINENWFPLLFSKKCWVLNEENAFHSRFVVQRNTERELSCSQGLKVLLRYVCVLQKNYHAIRSTKAVSLKLWNPHENLFFWIFSNYFRKEA